MQSNSSKNLDLPDPKSDLPPPPPLPPLRSRSKPDSYGPPPPVVRSRRPDQSPYSPSPSLSPSTSPSPSKPPTPGLPSLPARRINTSPKPASNSQPGGNTIDWANLSDEDKQVFFSWLDEFFVKFTGDDSFIPKDQKQDPAPATKWSVPLSAKNAAVSMVEEKGQGPPVSTIHLRICLRSRYIL